MHGDLVAVARSLLPVPSQDRPECVARIVERAQAADLFRKKFGRAHPLWGDGTLRAVVAGASLPPEPPLSDGRYLQCLIAVLHVLAGRAGYPVVQDMGLGVAGSGSRRSP